MRALYLDTSILVTAVTSEPETRGVQNWLESLTEPITISDWARVEVAGALSFKVWTGQLEPEAREPAESAFESYARLALSAEATSADFLAAATIVRRVELAVRPPDALHMAICAGRGETLATRDRRMASAAEALGLAVAVL